MSLADAVEDEGSVAVSSPEFVVDLTATAGMSFLSMKLAVSVTFFAGIRKVVVGPRMLPTNSTPLVADHIFSPWPDGGFAVMVMISPGVAWFLLAVPPLTVILYGLSLSQIVTVAVLGDFWVKTKTNATVGQAVFASLTDGSISCAASGTTWRMRKH